MDAPTEHLVADLVDEAGDGLRAVAAYRKNEYEIFYMPGDVEDQYTEAEFDRIYGEMLYERSAGEYVASLYRLGEMWATVRLFEDGTLVNAMPTHGNGLIVSLGADADPGLRAVARTCRDWMTAVDTEDPLAVVTRD